MQKNNLYYTIAKWDLFIYCLAAEFQVSYHFVPSCLDYAVMEVAIVRQLKKVKKFPRTVVYCYNVFHNFYLKDEKSEKISILIYCAYISCKRNWHFTNNKKMTTMKRSWKLQIIWMQIVATFEFSVSKYIRNYQFLNYYCFKKHFFWFSTGIWK